MYRLLLALLLIAGPAWASGGTCTAAVTVQSSGSTTVVPAEDVTGGRNFLFLQNIGAQPMFCAVGSNNAATLTNGIYLPPLGSIYFTSVQGTNGVFYKFPLSDVSCIASTGNTTAVYCDY